MYHKLLALINLQFLFVFTRQISSMEHCSIVSGMRLQLKQFVLYGGWTNCAIKSPYDCDLLTMSNSTHAVHSTNILRATSIVHECPSCNFMYTLHSVEQERENVTVKKLVHNTTYSHISQSMPRRYVACLFCPRGRAE